MSNWVLNDEGNAIGLSSDEGYLEVNSITIWEAEFEAGQRSAHMRPSTDLPDIRFNESFLSLVPLLKLTEEGAVQLVLNSPHPEVQITSWPNSDQIVIDGLWSALDVNYLDGLASDLASHDIGLGSNLSSQQLVWLYWESGFDVASDIEPSDLSSAFSGAGNEEFDGQLVRAVLYPYQVQGAELLSSMADQGLGALLADEMGLGKTMQAIYLLAHTSARRIGPCLVVVPASILANWQRELERFAPQLDVATHGGPLRTGVPGWFEGLDVVLTTFDVVVRDSFLLGSIGWSLVIVDEAQMIKNPDALRSVAVKSLKRRTSLAITGTPIENSLTDLWSIMDFVAHDFLGGRDEFRDRFPDEVDAAADLSKKIAPLTIRRRVSAVAKDLPERIDIPTPIYASDALADLYESVRAVHGRNQLAALTKLRQVCACPGAVSDSWRSIRFDFPKFDRTMEILAEVFAEGGKALIFASFTDAIDDLVRNIQSTYPGVFVASVDGRRSPADRQETIDSFSAVASPGALVLNPQAAGVGLNIQAANHVIHFTPEWNPATVAQASARAYRRGQTLPVFVYYLYYVSTVEQVMMERMDMKRDLQDAGLSSTGGAPGPTDIARALQITPIERLL